jgi:hypothetical protein
MTVDIRSDVVVVSQAPMSIVGSSYSEIIPTQPHVNRTVVDEKLSGSLSGASGMTCWINHSGKIYLLDGHHTFVACCEAGLSAEIKIKKFGFPAGDYSSWYSVSWSNFEPAKNKIKKK